MKQSREASLIRTNNNISSTASGIISSFLKLTQVIDVRLSLRGGILALLVGSLLTLSKLLLDSQLSLIPKTAGISFPPPVEPINIHTGCRRITRSNKLGAGGIPDISALPNSYLPCKDYVKPGSSTHELRNISKYFTTSVVDSELLHAAQDAATQPLPPEMKPRVAFLFIVRQKIPLERMWERFFAGAEDEESYSVYIHASSGSGRVVNEEFPKHSLFYNRSISAKLVKRFDISLVDVMRRLLAFALLDTARANLWFVLVSEACVPVRSFPYVYDYFMNSTTSFVEAFSPTVRSKRWQTEPVFKMEQLRKGELWMSMHRRHAGMVVGDVTFYRKFKADCRSAPGNACTLDEQYAQTLLHTLDLTGIANRSVTYVDWSNPNHGASPRRHTAEVTNAALFEKIQSRTENLDGQYMDSSDDVNHTMKTCVYNGRPHAPCFLFARKFSGDPADVKALLQIPKRVLGY